MHLVVDAHLVRRVIKRHRRITRVGLDVPHGHTCCVPRDVLLSIASARELGADASSLAPFVALVARPDEDDAETLVARQVIVWRRAFHAHVHLTLDARLAAGKLSEADVRARIDRVGQTEFDEVRAVLRAEELVHAPGDDREAYVELAALFLELSRFDPSSASEIFPTLGDPTRVAALLAEDIDVEALLTATRPEGAPTLAEIATRASEPEARAPTSGRPTASAMVPARRAWAAAMRARGNLAHAAIEHLAAGDRAASDEDLAALGARLADALEAPAAHDRAPSKEGWVEALAPLVRAAASSGSPRAIEARVLHQLQKVCVDAERERRTVDVVTWVTSLGRRAIVRPLPAVRPVRIARHVRGAGDDAHRARIEPPDRERLEHTLRDARHRAEANAHRALAPALAAALDEVGLRPKNLPEGVAREKLVDEVVDLALEHGFLGLSQLRDALSRSNLKLPDLTPSSLAFGDALLRADALLAVSLDGVYRRGEIYLRALQKVSSVAFGTAVGRFVSLHLVLPLLAAFIVLEGSSHLVHPIAHALGHHGEIHLVSPISLGALAAFVWALVHVAAVRRGTAAFFRAIGSVLGAVLFGVPRWLFTRPFVTALLSGRAFAWFVRLVVEPAAIAGAGLLAARALGVSREIAIASAAAVAVLLAVFLGTPQGERAQELVLDHAARRFRHVTRRVLPGVFAWVVDLFRLLVERVDRGIYAVDEWLTFKEGQGNATLVAKGALGAVWFFVTYLVRVYVNLLIEPQINPIKHFPVVTVSHKIMLPMAPTILGAMKRPLVPVLGAALANTVSGTTVLLLPGVFGFLAWELKESFRLYAANRRRTLAPVRIGHHGETMSGLLVPGFHQGTIPKLFAKLRRAVRTGKSSLGAHREALHHVEHAIFTFVQRELCRLLSESPRFHGGPLVVTAVHLASNRVRVGIAPESAEADAAYIHFEEQSGRLVASVAALGFVDRLDPSSRDAFAAALAGLYAMSGVELVREQLQALVGAGVPYDVSDRGFVVWPGEGYETEVLYDLGGTGELHGVIRGSATTAPTLDASKLVFARQPIAWDAWVATWGSEESIVPLTAGPPILAPPRAATNASA